jgi:hypothetical protein
LRAIIGHLHGEKDFDSGFLLHIFSEIGHLMRQSKMRGDDQKRFGLIQSLLERKKDLLFRLFMVFAQVPPVPASKKGFWSGIVLHPLKKRFAKGGCTGDSVLPLNIFVCGEQKKWFGTFWKAMPECVGDAQMSKPCRSMRKNHTKIPVTQKVL